MITAPGKAELDFLQKRIGLIAWRRWIDPQHLHLAVQRRQCELLGY